MKQFIYLTLIAFLCSCNSSKDPIKRVNKKDVETFFKSLLKEMDSTATLKNLTIVGLDTISERDLYDHYSAYLGTELSNTKERGELLLEKYKSNLQLRNLSYGLSGTLYSNYKQEAEDSYKEISDLISKDSLMRQDIFFLDSIYKIKDSIQPQFYEVEFFYNYERANKSVVKDTGYVKLDKEFMIVDRKEYIRKLNDIYTTKSGFDIE